MQLPNQLASQFTNVTRNIRYVSNGQHIKGFHITGYDFFTGT